MSQSVTFPVRRKIRLVYGMLLLLIILIALGFNDQSYRWMNHYLFEQTKNEGERIEQLNLPMEQALESDLAKELPVYKRIQRGVQLLNGTTYGEIPSERYQDQDEAIKRDRDGVLIRVPFNLPQAQGYYYQFYPNYVLKSQFQKEYWLRYGMIGLIGLGLVLLFMVYRYLIVQWIQSLVVRLQNTMEEDGDYQYQPVGYPAMDRLDQSIHQLVHTKHEEVSELHSKLNQLQLLINHLNLGVIQLDPSGKVVLMNPFAARLLAIDTPLLHQHYQVLIKSRTLVEMIQQTKQHEVTLHREIELYVPTFKQIDVTILPDRLKKGDRPMMLVLLYDITAVRQLETVQSEFVTNASHELRTPITAIKGFTETLLSGALQDEAAAYQFVEIIDREANRLELIANDILSLAQAERGEELAQETFDLAESISMIVGNFQPIAEAKAIQIASKVDSSITITSHRPWVEQILINLIDNAIKYSEENGQVAVNCRREAETVVISIKDTGYGIAPEEQERIFERFYRVDKARSRHSGGTGLGLSIVRHMVTSLSGEIWVDSQLGKGSTFFVRLPINDRSTHILSLIHI